MREFKLTIYPAMEICDKKIEFYFDDDDVMLSTCEDIGKLLHFLESQGVLGNYTNTFFMEELNHGVYEKYRI